MAKESVSRRSRTSLFYGAALFVLVGLPVVLHFLPEILASRLELKSLRGTWQVCALPSTTRPLQSLGQCHWQSVRFPGNIEHQGIPALQVMAYRTKLSTPESCTSDGPGCGIVIGTLSDPTDAYLNAHFLGRIGSPPPHSSYSQTFPAKFGVSRNLWKPSNELVLISYPLTRKDNGILRGPIGVFTNQTGTSIVELLIGETVVLPLAIALLLTVFGCLATYSLYEGEWRLRGLKAYMGYCFVTALYLVSLSRLPREYLPLDVGYPLHFAIRFLSEFFFVSLICALFGFRGWILKGLRGIYLGVCALLLFSLALMASGILPGSEALLTSSLWIANVGCFFFLSTSALGISFCVRDKTQWKSRLLFPFFVAVFFMQLSDILALSGVIQDIYFGRFYPFAVALVLGYVIWKSGEEERRRLAIERELGRQAAQVAHDVRAPLGALKAVAKDAGDAEAKEILLSAVERISGISEDLLVKFRVETPKHFPGETVNTLIRALLAEKRATLPESIKLTQDVSARPPSFRVREADLLRILSNLIDNSVKAIAPHRGEIRLSTEADDSEFLIRVSDDGPGIPNQILTSLQAGESVSTGGHGLGLAHARRQMERWGGNLEIDSEYGSGTTTTLRFQL